MGGEKSDTLSAAVKWLPLVVLTAAAVAARPALPPWAFMWAMAFAIFAELKWQTYWVAREKGRHSAGRAAAYLLLWPGMDAEAFLYGTASPPQASALSWAAAQTAFGAVVYWLGARQIPAELWVLQAWSGMVGLIFLLHFGSFRVIALLWQKWGVCAEPIMRNPAAARSLAEFWGQRWNLGFRDLAHELVFRPMQRRAGAAAATMLVFMVSGMIHESVISLPAGAGYGLPTLYFLIQAVGLLIERRALKDPPVWVRRAYVFAFTAGPAYWLFHPPFLRDVMLPFMRVTGAIAG